MDVAGKRVTVLGLGRFGGGVGVTRWLCEQGAVVTVSDAAAAEVLADSIRRLEGLDVALHLGGHDPRDLVEADLLVVNPAVRPDAEPLKVAEQAGVPRTTEINLFLRRCRAPIVGVTGTVGKSTTTAMVGEILARRFRAHVGGNIGRSLLSDLGHIEPDHVVVLEFSSFQLYRLPEAARSPHVAVVTNFAANHLDWHGSEAAYADAKKNIFRFQGPGDVLVLNAADGRTPEWKGEAGEGVRVELFGAAAEPFELAVVGEHNQANAQAAWAAARQFGVDRETAAAALRRFAGLPHRLQLVCERRGVRFYNDSKCTTPEGGVVAMQAFAPRCAVVIVGGHDKGASFEALGKALAGRAKAVIAMGATAQKILAAVEAARSGGTPAVARAADLAEAVRLAERHAEPGDAIALSPACASYDMFLNYEQRGQEFLKIVERGAR
jgi:UDP-N-acetylmuramoylalanine--D-glutamate ligase